MKNRCAQLAAMLLIAVIFASSITVRVPPARSLDDGGNIDVFTQSTPYSGRGQNMPSDAFGPDDVVFLFAAVTYNRIAVGGILVAFKTIMPSGASFSFSERTNISGIATVNFTIPKPSPSLNESAIFGLWQVLANVMINGVTYQDALTFRVDWAVKLISVTPIDGNLTSRNTFGIGGDVGFEIALRSIAMTDRLASISLVIKDELSVPVNFSEIDHFVVQPDEKLVYLYAKLKIPASSFVGNGSVEVSAFHDNVNASGVPYCPSIFATFAIVPFQPLTMNFHDVGIVRVIPSPTSVEVGQIVNVTAIAQNEGTEAERFNVSAYYNASLIGTIQGVNLTSYSYATLNFALNTSNLIPGNYSISVSIPSLPDEADLTDNVYLDGVVQVKPKSPPVIHDIAVIGIRTNGTSLYVGESLRINVNVTNKGTASESFSVGAYYNVSLIALLPVQALSPQTTTTLVFSWQTSEVGIGAYQISAYAPLTNDINISNNALMDGFVQIKAVPPKTRLLSINSNPIGGVSFTINGSVTLTPYSARNFEGTYTIAFPSQYIDTQAGLSYNFSHWEDESTNPTRTINLVTDLTLTAYYERNEYTLKINSTDGGTTNPSPGSYQYSKGTQVQVTALPSSGYTFDRWMLDGINRTEQQVLIFMNADHTLTAYFKKIVTHTLSVASSPISGVGFTINGIQRTTFYSATVEEKNYTIIMPDSFNDAGSGKTYNFEKWENGLTSTNRTILLDTDMSLTAYYKETVSGYFVPGVFWWFLLALLLLLFFILLIIWYYRRRRREEDLEEFQSGFAAWYYCYGNRRKRY